MQHYNLNDILVRLRLSLGADVLCCLPDVFLHCSDVCFKATLSVLVDVRLDKICTAMWIITYHLMKGVASEFSGSFFYFTLTLSQHHLYSSQVCTLAVM